MNYFLDLGTHYLENNNRFSGCESGLSLFEEQSFFGAKAPYDWHILTFEPSAHAFAHNQTVLPSIEKRFASIRMFNAAIADFDGQMTFKWLPYWSAASTCVMEPLNEISSQYCQEQEVEAIDIKRVVEQIVQEDEDANIHVKCDIEGAEFTVLPRLLEIDNVGQWVKAIYVEWHDRFWKDRPRENEIQATKATIIKDCASKQVALYDWI